MMMVRGRRYGLVKRSPSYMERIRSLIRKVKVELVGAGKRADRKLHHQMWLLRPSLTELL